jgi:hypothetical protein
VHIDAVRAPIDLRSSDFEKIFVSRVQVRLAEVFFKLDHHLVRAWLQGFHI